MIGELAFAFTAGTVATVNPCGFALLPAYLARRLGKDDEGRNPQDTAMAHALLVGATTTLGFLLVFGAGGAAIMLGAAWLAALFPWAGFVIGLGLAATGVFVLAGRPLVVPQPGFPDGTAAASLRSDLLFGAAYAAASLSCTLPIFLAVTGVSTTLGVIGSVLNLGAYTLGIATVLTAVSVAAALSRRTLIAAIGSMRPYLSRVAGGLLFLAGAYVAYFWGATLFAADLAGVDGIVAVGKRLSGLLRRWLTGQAGQIALYIVLALISALWSWRLWQWRLKAGLPAGHDRGVRVSLGSSHRSPQQAEARLTAVPAGSRGWSKHGENL